MWKVSTSLKQPTSAFTAARLSRFHTDQGSERGLRGLLHCPQIKRTSCRAVNAYLSSIPSSHSIWLVCVGSLQRQGARHALHDSNFLSLNFRTELGFIYRHICCFSKEKSMRAFVIGLSLTISINSICLFCTWASSLTKRIHIYWAACLPRNKFHGLFTSLIKWGTFLMRISNGLYYLLGELGFHIVWAIAKKIYIPNKIKLLQRKWRLLPIHIRSPSASATTYSQNIRQAGPSHHPHSHTCFHLIRLPLPSPPPENLSSFLSTLHSFTPVHDSHQTRHDQTFQPSTFSWLFAHTSIYVCFSPPAFPWPQSSQRKQFVFSSSPAIFNIRPTWWFSLFGDGKEYVARGERMQGKEMNSGWEDRGRKTMERAEKWLLLK